ncbi:hypothetical protein WKW50_08445 [Ochrobactrum sp. GPK 3]
MRKHFLITTAILCLTSGQTLAKDYKMTTPIPDEIVTPDSVDTRIAR